MSARAAGSYPYKEGFRLCVMSLGNRALRKTSLQSAFGDHGHVVQIETPKPNLAFVAFDDAADARDAMLCLDGKVIDGLEVSVTKAGPKPVYKSDRQDPAPQILMTTQSEREELSSRNNTNLEGQEFRCDRARGRDRDGFRDRYRDRDRERTGHRGSSRCQNRSRSRNETRSRTRLGDRTSQDRRHRSRDRAHVGRHDRSGANSRDRSR